jgi:hypothetical protein
MAKLLSTTCRGLMLVGINLSAYFHQVLMSILASRLQEVVTNLQFDPYFSLYIKSVLRSRNFLSETTYPLPPLQLKSYHL